MSCRIINRSAVDPDLELEALVAGLVADPATLSPKYFYDELGCALYGAICRLPEYYPTRTEAELFREHRAEIAGILGSGRQFVDLGAGDCCKAMGWLPFVMPSRYIAVDIAEAEIHRALTGMARDWPELELVGVVTDFSRAWTWTACSTRGPRLFSTRGPASATSLPAGRATCSRKYGRSAAIVPAADC
jgi:uncharacterized SAM-dependent methyltransferase